jgi:hypothetical protein
VPVHATRRKDRKAVEVKTVIGVAHRHQRGGGHAASDGELRGRREHAQPGQEALVPHSAAGENQRRIVRWGH